MLPTTKKEMVQCWTALFLTTGEFGIGIWLFIHEGHVLAIYLAFTYLMRETSGGHHYHQILVTAYDRIRTQKVHVDDNPFYKQ